MKRLITAVLCDCPLYLEITKHYIFFYKVCVKRVLNCLRPNFLLANNLLRIGRLVCYCICGQIRGDGQSFQRAVTHVYFAELNLEVSLTCLLFVERRSSLRERERELRRGGEDESQSSAAGFIAVLEAAWNPAPAVLMEILLCSFWVWSVSQQHLSAYSCKKAMLEKDAVFFLTAMPYFFLFRK